MRAVRKSVLLLLVLVLLGLVGCQKLNVKKNIDLGPGDINEQIIEGPRRDQDIKVTVTSSAPVDVYVILSANAEEVKKKLELGKAPESSKLLASETKTGNASLKAIIPAKQEFRVLLSGARKKASVELTITNQ